MATPTRDNHEPVRTYHAAEDLFRDPACTKIVQKGGASRNFFGSSHNVFLERSGEEYRLLFNKHQGPLQMLSAGTFEEVYRFTISSLPDTDLKMPYWMDISDYPDLPLNTWYSVFQDQVKEYIAPQSPDNTNYGDYIIYGLASIGQPDKRGTRVVSPQQDWLVIEHPARKVYTSDVRWVLRARSRISLSLRLKAVRWLKRLRLIPRRVVEIPGYLKIYGKPPASWRTEEQHHFSPRH